MVVLSFIFRYIQRKNLLQLLKSDDLTLIETAPKRWTSLDSPREEENISGKLSLLNAHLVSPLFAVNDISSVNCLQCNVHNGIF